MKNIIFSDNQKVTKEVVDFYEENPDELDLIIDKEYFNIIFLGVFFILGISITVFARMLQYFYGVSLGDFINNVVLDVLSELGIAIFGGAIVAYLLEFLNKRQYQQNIKFRRQVKAILEKRKANNNKA